MRIWEFDRLGGIASGQFNINQDGLQFVSTILGFLWMNKEQLGFDPTITTERSNTTGRDRRLITINRNGQTERLVIDKLMIRAPCIAGRAITCWKAYREDDPRTPLVVKDSWQYTEREEEGELLKEATEKGVVNVARYYHHETVFVRNEADDIRGNVRGGLNITDAKTYRPGRSVLPPSMSGARKGRSGSAAGVKRSSSQTGAPLPPNSGHVRPLQRMLAVMLCQIGYIGVLLFATTDSPSTRRAPDPPCLRHWRAVLTVTSVCTGLASYTETYQSTIS